VLLAEFLENKPLYYEKIDYTRMPRVYEKIQEHLRLPKIIHLVGTNGKGTTGRFLASALYSLGFATGHYTSPHILEFNERIWKNGENVANDTLEVAHKRVLEILSTEDAHSLSYFEYTTLLAMLVFQECEYVVLEAGLGGEHDATAVFDSILTLVTPIDFDHEAFLGTTIEAIATTKLNAAKQAMIVGVQKHKEVYAIAKDTAAKTGITLFSFGELLDERDREKVSKVSKQLGLVPYLEENLQLCVAALKYLKLDYSDKNFLDARLFGRVSQISNNILLDVGHNPLAATSIAKSLQGKRYTLVYNSYKDKNYQEILEILQPVIAEVEIIAVAEERIEEKALLCQKVEELGLICRDFTGLEDEKHYLVFGSFSVAETFLKEYFRG
jgi:dihydrofolate synthase/folylpolyglutamate synthase